MLIAGCGRINFDPSGGTGSPIDAPIDSSLTRTVTFGETGTADFANVTTDTFVRPNAPNANYGVAVELVIDQVPVVNALVRFDLSAIPRTAIVMSASLDLFLTDPGLGGQIDGFRVLEPWNGGTQDDLPGYANHTFRLEGPPAVAWAGAGCSGASRDPAPLFTVVLPAGTVPISGAVTATIVDDWVSTPANNHGLVLVQTVGGDGPRVASSEYVAGGSERRPLLTVTYVLP